MKKVVSPSSPARLHARVHGHVHTHTTETHKRLHAQLTHKTHEAKITMTSENKEFENLHFYSWIISLMTLLNSKSWWGLQGKFKIFGPLLLFGLMKILLQLSVTKHRRAALLHNSNIAIEMNDLRTKSSSKCKSWPRFTCKACLPVVIFMKNLEHRAFVDLTICFNVC